MKKLLLLTILMCLGFTTAWSQAASYMIHIDAKTGEAVQVAGVKLGEVKNLNLFGVALGDWESQAFTALRSSTSLGAGLVKKWSIADNLSLIGGLSARSAQAAGSERISIRGGIVVGLTYKF